MRNSGIGRIALLLCLIMLTVSACTAAEKTAREEEGGKEESSEEQVYTERADEELPAEEEHTERADEEMKLSVLGDSISTFAGWIPEGNVVFYPENGPVQDVSQTWWKIVLDETGLGLCSNGSSTGSTCFGDSEKDDPGCGCSDLRISQLAGVGGEAPDIILVYMGTNDVLKSAPVGDNDGLRAVEAGVAENFSDGYTLILDKILKQYPAARVYCCTLLPVGDWGTTEAQPFVPFVNGQNLTSETYSDQIRLIAKNRALPVIDLEKCGINFENMAEMTADGVHPTPAGMRLIADTAVRCLSEEQR